VAEAWPHVRIWLDGASSHIEGGEAGVGRRVVAHVEPGPLALEELSVQVVHGPLAADGSFDEHRMTVVDMHPDADGRFAATFVPEQAGRWGVAVRAMPTHPAMTNPVDTGLLVTD
jgi:starch phosphorylase